MTPLARLNVVGMVAAGIMAGSAQWPDLPTRKKQDKEHVVVHTTF
jgi:hypothetical protein